MMDALITTFVAQRKERMCSGSCDEIDGAKIVDRMGTHFIILD